MVGHLLLWKYAFITQPRSCFEPSAVRAELLSFERQRRRVSPFRPLFLVRSND